MALKLQKRFYLSTKDIVAQRPDGVPNWFVNDFKKQYWFGDKDHPDISYFYSKTTEAIYIQYGQNVKLWGTVKFLAEKVEISNEVFNPADGSITAEVRVTPLAFASRKTDFVGTTGPRVNWTVKVNNVTVYQFSGITIDEFTNGVGSVQTIPVKVAAEEELTRSALTISVVYPGGEFPNSTVTTGFSVYNPNPKDYIPNFLVKDKKGYSLNLHNGSNIVMFNGKKYDVSRELRTGIGKNLGYNRVVLKGEEEQALPYLDDGSIDVNWQN